MMHANDIDIWCRNTETLDESAIAATDRHLCRDERNRRDRFLSPEARRDYAAAHDLLRRCLSTYVHMSPAAWRFSTTDHGRPVIREDAERPTGLWFSLSHTTGFVACAISTARAVGIDVERIPRALNVEELANGFFAPSEAEALERQPAAQRRTRFIELWTLKEAVLKAIGTGLFTSLDAVAFRFDDAGGLSILDQPEPVGWHLALFAPADGYRMAVAAQGPQRFRLHGDANGSAPALLGTSSDVEVTVPGAVSRP